MASSEMEAAAAHGLTAKLIDKASRLRFDELPADVRRVARDCLTDWLGCTFAALDEPVSKIVAASARDEGGHPQATLIGQGTKGSVVQAALVNGTTSHALDYDDLNLIVPGHLSAAIIPALLALAEFREASGADFIAAFVAGYETACRIGTLVEPAHYANGFHATATIGSLGAAMACAHLLKLSPTQASHALGIAGTQAAGLKAMFGSMAKPLHAGLASQSGLRSVLLAQKGLISRGDVLECAQGFSRVHGDDFHPQEALATPAGGYHLLNNLFKFHAACYSTHSTIEAVAGLRHEHDLDPGSVLQIDVLADDGCSICNIQSPVTGLEAKFSLRASAAFALLGIDTSALESWGRVTEPEVVSVLNRVEVELVPGMTLSDSVVTVHLRDGHKLRREFDCGSPMREKAAQSERVSAKFTAIASPVIGIDPCKRVLSLLDGLEGEPNLGKLMDSCRDTPTTGARLKQIPG